MKIINVTTIDEVIISYDNYFINTLAVYKCCKTPRRKPDYVSESGSIYWYGTDKTGDYVIRRSNHWSAVGSKKTNNVIECGNVASCYWYLRGKNSKSLTGKCYIKNFSKIN